MEVRERTILIVEDDAPQALDLNLILQQAGGRIVGTAFSAERALEIANSCPPSISIVDVNLGSVTRGTTLARFLAKRYQSHIIFLTFDPAAVQNANLDFNHVLLSKPVNRIELLNAVEEGGRGLQSGVASDQHGSFS